jgi:hypothetical protein
LKLNAVAHGSKAGDKVSSADAAFTKQYWALQQCPNEDVYANRLTQFCDKWPRTGEYLDKLTKAKTAWRLCDWHALGLQTMGMKTNNMSEIENALLVNTRLLDPLKMLQHLVQALCRRYAGQESNRLVVMELVM